MGSWTLLYCPTLEPEAPVAQLDRVADFESDQALHNSFIPNCLCLPAKDLRDQPKVRRRSNKHETYIIGAHFCAR